MTELRDPMAATGPRRDCAICGGAPSGLKPGPGLFQLKCRLGKHRTRYYLDRDSCIQAWNFNQRHKLAQGSGHG